MSLQNNGLGCAKGIMIGAGTKLRRPSIILWLVPLIPLMLAACGSVPLSDQPEFNPARWAPASVEREWTPAPNERASVRDDAVVINSADSNRAPEGGHSYDMAALIDLALEANPETRGDWDAARGSAYSWARSRAPFYPLINANSQSGYERIVDQVPKHWGTLKNWQSTSLLSLNYDLIDFGRREAAAQAAHENLIAANFAFNRAVQSVVFNVERAFYRFDASRAGIAAAQAVLRLATADRRAVQRRHDLGLATGPDLLLARQREAEAEYDLENIDLNMRDAQADLAVALGLKANTLPDIESFDSQPLPAKLGPAVDDLIKLASADRPDLAAAGAQIQNKEEELKLARASMYPVVDASAYYGSHAFNYELSNPPTPVYTAMAPEYAATLTLKWDVFAGLEHLNAIGQAEADRDQARADLRGRELDVASEVWRAYYAFQTSMKKYQYAEALLLASQSSYDANYKSFGHGLVNIIDLLAAERDLANAQYTMIQSRADVLVAAAAIAFATGSIEPQAR
ncbi:MAG: TolC family protein [Candidatus Binataceae bacterium]|jgi:outer membrane protein TolC